MNFLCFNTMSLIVIVTERVITIVMMIITIVIICLIVVICPYLCTPDLIMLIVLKLRKTALEHILYVYIHIHMLYVYIYMYIDLY